MLAAFRVLLSACLLASVACGRPQLQQTERPDSPRRRPPAETPTLVEFQKTWRQQMVSTLPDLAQPVTRPERKPPVPPWQPRIVSECLLSSSGEPVPHVTVTWTEPADRVPELAATAAQRVAPAVPRLRFDLALHHNGLGRNYYSAALAANRNERFKLPSNSALLNDEAAVMLTGPGLFPQLVDFSVQPVQDRDTRQSFALHTLVLRELNHGLSYTLSLDRPAAGGWSEQGQVVFLTPVCPTTF